ncbi:MAG: CotH kinase family protein [Planctomycetota bacterium]|nr:CotH kinase family protein [Planctomycetota bacterium]
MKPHARAVLSHSIGVIWRWSLLVTLPVSGLFLLWLSSFAGSFGDFRLRYDIEHPFGFANEGKQHARQLLNDLQLKLSTRGLPTDIPVLQLAVHADRLATLNANLPHSGFEEVRGQLCSERGWVDVDLRYRGDFYWHWAYPKKSWRVQVKDQQLAFGLSKFHVIAPKLPSQINDVVAYRLAQMLEVLAPQAKAVVLFVNGENHGLHLLVEHAQESLLRDRGRMPSDLYSGELVARDKWQGIHNLVFEHPGLWSKMAVNNHFALDNRGPLEALCAVLAMPPSEASMARLNELVDLEAFGKFLALETLLQSFHNDETHNWRLCYDPWRQAFQPLIWDPNAWGDMVLDAPPDLQAGDVSLDPVASRLQLRLLANPTVLAARARALQKFLHSGQAQLFLTEVEDLADSASAVADIDPFLRPPDPAAVVAQMQHLPTAVGQLFEHIATAFSATRPVTYNQEGDALILQIADRLPVQALTLDFANEAPKTPLELCWSDGKREHRVALATQHQANRSQLRCQVDLAAQLQPQPGIRADGHPLLTRRPIATTYTIRSAEGFEGLQLVAVERCDGSTETALRDDQLQASPIDLLLGIGQDQRPALENWSGKVRIDGYHIVESDIVLAPGTEVTLGPGACLVFRGRVLAAGRETAPIRFQRAGAEPWGAVALQGTATSGSRLQHCMFDGGSGAKSEEGLFEYCGMFSIHDSSRVSLENCTFENSSIYDDVVHAVYSEVEFQDCYFAASPADGLDLDQCQATLENCRFEGQGNDGLDLMTCNAIVRNCSFTGCGDKGISVGERSRILVAESRFDDCVVGIQTKDDSDAAVLNCTIRGGTRALDAIVKNWRYGTGGRVTADRCVLVGATTPPMASAHSQMILRDSTVEPALQPAANILVAEPEPAGLRSNLPFSISGRHGMATSIWQTAPPNRRGAL